MNLILTIYTFDDAKRKSLMKQAAALFARYEPRPVPKRDDKLDMVVPMDDPNVPKLLKQFDATATKAGAGSYNDFSFSPAELERARFSPLVCFNAVEDDDDDYRPINRFPRVLCSRCGFPDVSRPPNPYLIRKAPVKSAEIFSSSVGLLIVRPRVLALLEAVLSDQIESGDVRVAGKGTPAAAERLHWVRPTRRIGELSGKKAKDSCPACKRPTEVNLGSRQRRIQPKPFPRVTHYGDATADIALCDGYLATFNEDTKEVMWFWQIAVSGALLTYLKKNGVKGIATSPGAEFRLCYFSDKGEPPMEPAPRSLGSASPATKAVKPKPAPQVALPKDLPWGSAKDGYVYFYLTTPEVVIVDPMTFEEDTGGPYKLKKFKPGLHRIPASAVKEGTSKRGVAVDSASLLLIDGAFFTDLQETFDWDKCTKSNGSINKAYLDKVSKQIGNRFGFLSLEGDGEWMIDAKAIERVE